MSTLKKILKSLVKVIFSIVTILVLVVVAVAVYPLVQDVVIDARASAIVDGLLVVLFCMLLVKFKKFGSVFTKVVWLFVIVLAIGYYFFVWKHNPKKMAYDASVLKPSTAATTLQTRDNNWLFELRELLDQYVVYWYVPKEQEIFDWLMTVQINQDLREQFGKDRYQSTGAVFANAWSWALVYLDKWYQLHSGELQKFTFSLDAILHSGKPFQDFYADNDGNQDCTSCLLPYSLRISNMQGVTRTLSSVWVYLISKGEYSQWTAYLNSSLELAKTRLFVSGNSVINSLIGNVLYGITLQSIETALQNFEIPSLYKQQLAEAIENPINTNELYRSAINEEYHYFEHQMLTAKQYLLHENKFLQIFTSLALDEETTRERARYYYSKMIKGENINELQEITPKNNVSKMLLQYAEETGAPLAMLAIENGQWRYLLHAMFPRIEGLQKRFDDLEVQRARVYSQLTK